MSGQHKNSILGLWRTEYPEKSSQVRIEYSFLNSGSGYERISRTLGETVLELHRFIWKIDDCCLKLTYITEPVATVTLNCGFSDGLCVLSDFEENGDEMTLLRVDTGRIEGDRF